MYAIVIWSDHREVIDAFEHDCMVTSVNLWDCPCKFDWRCVNLDEHNVLEGIL